MTPKCASTISAILRAANSPPRFSGSGCRIFTTSCLSNSANCCFVERLSPVAMGTGLRRATSTMAGMLVSGSTQSVMSDAQGRYRVADLGVGDYEVQAGQAGFSTLVHKGITL